MTAIKLKKEAKPYDELQVSDGGKFCYAVVYYSIYDETTTVIGIFPHIAHAQRFLNTFEKYTLSEHYSIREIYED